MKSKLALYAVLLSIHVPMCVIAGVEKKVAEDSGPVVSVTHDGMAVKAEAIRNSIGSTLGFRVEILNLDAKTNLTFTTGDDISEFFRVDVIDKKGFRASPMPEVPVQVNLRTQRDADYRSEVIFPRTSHAWFIPLPKMIRSDPHKFSNDENLVPIGKGKYEIEIVARMGYFRQKQGETSAPKPSEVRQVKLTLPRVTVTVDPDFLGADIINAYIRNDSGGAERK